MVKKSMVNLTTTMITEKYKVLKQIALDKDMTISAVIRLWLQEHQKVEVDQ